MNVRRLIAGVLMIVMLVSGTQIVPALAETVQVLVNVPVERNISTGDTATHDNAVKEEETATSSDAKKPSFDSIAGVRQDGEVEYRLEAENEAVASSDKALISGDGTRMELQQYGSVTFRLKDAEGFQPGKYLVSVNMNGSSQKISVSVSGQQKGNITKANAGWDVTDLNEYYYHGILELTETDSITVAEAENQFAHLDWIHLKRVDTVYWIEGENSSVASYEGDADIHSDGDRVEINGGGSVTLALSAISGFSSGTYKLYAGLNGARSSMSVTVDDGVVGTITASGTGQWEKGTCMDYDLETTVELKPDSRIKLSDTDGSWGHMDYIRLERTGDLTPRFDETDAATGIRVVAEKGVLPDSTVIKTDVLSSSDKKIIRESFREENRKVSFYRFHLEDGRGEDIDLDDLAEQGEIMVYLPVPQGYSEDSLLYYAKEPEDDPEEIIGYEQDNGRIKIQLESCGIYMIADENVWQLEGEDFYGKATDGGNAADLQPFDEIKFAVPKDESFESGAYHLFLNVCGYQNYTIKVDGVTVSSVTKDSSDWGDYELCTMPSVLKLSGGEVISVLADNNYGWVDFIRLVPGRSFETEENGISIKAEAGVVPVNAQFSVEPLNEPALENIRNLFGFTEEHAPLMSFYDISLFLDGTTIQPAGTLVITLPVPDGFDKDILSLYYIGGNGKKTRIPFTVSDDGGYVKFETNHLSCYGLINQALGSEFFYAASDYYHQTTGSGQMYADLQPGDEIEFPVSAHPGFVEGNYRLSLRANGNRTKLMVKVNGIPVGMLSRTKTSFSEDEDMNEAVYEDILHLTQEDIITLYAPGTEGMGPYGWVDYIKLKESEQAPDVETKAKNKVILEAEDFWPDELEENGKAANLNNPGKKLEIPILKTAGFEENDYLFTLYTTGTMRSYQVSVNGSYVLSGERTGSGYGMKYMTKEIGTETLHLKPGDILCVEFPQQNTDNYGNWVDRIVLNSGRRPTESGFFSRMGGRVLKELAKSPSQQNSPAAYEEKGNLIYQGEAYYTMQKDNPAADLQPGEQILIPLWENDKILEGSYRLSIRSCGNRESFSVKVNGVKAGSISRKGTGYGMDSMTDDAMGGVISLKASDTLVIEGQTGGKYGWVDYISLTPVQPANGTEVKSMSASYTWEAENFYAKQSETPSADLQPGEEIVIPLDANELFTAGAYFIMAVSNGDRTALGIKVNGTAIGSISRNKTNFAMSGMTMDPLLRPVELKPGDSVSICAPGEPGAADGPWGWVDRLVLIKAPEANPQIREEYRYPAHAYGMSSLYLAAADLQPNESLVIPLSDNNEFIEGDYRVIVISNGTRERFDIMANNMMIGSIHRAPSDYGDNGMSADTLESIMHLKPSDVLKITAQDGDFYGWVSALILEPVR